jgi:hypothetical protein
LLQVARSAAFTVVVSIEPAGIAALGAHVLSRWVPYQVYRLYARWPNARPELVRLISFVLLSLMIVCSLGLSILLGQLRGGRSSCLLSESPSEKIGFMTRRSQQVAFSMMRIMARRMKAVTVVA